MKLKNIPKVELPRERLLMYGEESLSNEELLSIILKTGTKKYNVKEVSYNLLSVIGDVSNLKDIGINTLEQVEGIGKVKAIELKAIIELGRRIYQEVLDKDLMVCNSPDKIIKYFNYLFRDSYQEEFYCLYLDNKKKCLGKKKLFVGSINKSIAHPREIFKEAYLLSASAIICIHNHPSGDPTPSKEDVMITRSIYEIGVIHSIKLVDHLIIGNNSYYSFYEDGKIN